MALLAYWSEWPPSAELLRGFVGYKPPTKEDRTQQQKAAAREVARTLGPTVDYERLPKWLRDAHAKNKPAK
jgi:hypothetical protein